MSCVALCLLGTNTDISGQINANGKDGMNDVHRAIIAEKRVNTKCSISGSNPNLPMSDGAPPVTLVMKSKFNIAKMLYILVKNGRDISSYDM